MLAFVIFVLLLEIAGTDRHRICGISLNNLAAKSFFSRHQEILRLRQNRIGMEQKIKSYIMAILTTLLETGGSPAGTLYLALGMNMGVWEIVRDVMLKAGVVSISNHYVTLTEKGKIIAEDINRALAAPKKVQNLAM